MHRCLSEEMPLLHRPHLLLLLLLILPLLPCLLRTGSGLELVGGEGVQALSQEGCLKSSTCRLFRRAYARRVPIFFVFDFFFWALFSSLILLLFVCLFCLFYLVACLFVCLLMCFCFVRVFFALFVCFFFVCLFFVFARLIVCNFSCLFVRIFVQSVHRLFYLSW